MPTQDKGSHEIVEGGSVTSPLGFKACGLYCGLKKSKFPDLGAVYCEVPAAAAGVFTTNLFQAAPVLVTRDSLSREARLQAVIVNSGNANACTGQKGVEDAYAMRGRMAEALGIPAHYVAVASTGVIGELLPMDKVLSGIDQVPGRLSREGSGDFCQAIMTTDLTRKECCVRLKVDGRTVHIGGAAKGSGMIHPNMATMLGFITTDAAIEPEHLQRLLVTTTQDTFNMITVDGDTSTNDMVVVMASGLAGNSPLKPDHPDWDAFAGAFAHVLEHLAKEIARDGEGATKLLEVRVTGAKSDEAARAIAKTVLGSSLVKTAVFGADANWGRIIAAVGRAGWPVNTETVDIRIGDIVMLEQSRPVPFDEAAAAEYLKTDMIVIRIDLHDGDGQAVGWGCDLTYEYVRINAAYRT